MVIFVAKSTWLENIYQLTKFAFSLKIHIKISRFCHLRHYSLRLFKVSKIKLFNTIMIDNKTEVKSVQLGKTFSFVKFVVEWGVVGWRERTLLKVFSGGWKGWWVAVLESEFRVAKRLFLSGIRIFNLRNVRTMYLLNFDMI